MKHSLLGIISSLLICASFSAWSARPTDINYVTKKSTITGNQYIIYAVRCSDGSKKTITAWNRKKKWCIGKNQKNCGRSKIKIAQKSCKV